MAFDLRTGMLWLAVLLLGFASGFLLANSGQIAQAYCVDSARIQPVFSPGADAALVPAIASAQKSLHIELYQFSFPALREALVGAAARGVEVKIILDPTVDSNLDTAQFLKARGVSVRWSGRNFRLTHSKTATIDAKRVIVGSINWSGAAMEKNREAAVIIDDASVAAEFERVFSLDWESATGAK
ncbi:MAG: phospholipase D family protein [Candidatus Micrarchaeota archaeon]